MPMQQLKPNIGISEKACKEVCEILTRLVADEFLLCSKTMNFHFNILGPRAKMLCDLFREQMEEIHKVFVKASEELRSCGHRVPMINEILKLGQVSMPREGDPEYHWPDANSMLRFLLEDHEHFLHRLQENTQRLEQVHELVVHDFLLDVIRTHRVLAFKLRVHMEKMA